jgi:hypothetical protein
VIAKNLLALRSIAQAKDEKQLAAALNTTVTVDLKHLPEELASLATYFQSGTAAAGGKFVPDPTAWQNKSILEIAQHEVRREQTWPFVVGFV